MEESNEIEEVKDVKVLEEQETTPKAPAEKPHYLCKFTIDGEVLVEVNRVDGKDQHKYHPLKTAYLLPMPPWLDDKHLSAMNIMHSLVTYIKKHNPTREVPVTIKELTKSGANHKSIEKLIKGGYLRKNHIALLNDKGKNRGSRACIYYTPQGRALVRAKFDETYALTENIA